MHEYVIIQKKKNNDNESCTDLQIISKTTYTDDKSDPWVGILGDTSVTGEHKSSDNDDGEDQKTNRSDVTKDVEGSELHIVTVSVVVVLDGGGISTRLDFSGRHG